ncbi:hypothetical protein [Salirhabdus salicampi]|uniref:hypothetical protein n=1 Tax=Salirhabdus salicampi TaxID=476102 RepID=UPI0020C2A550|nr:hypothetical protein [Salirhabdus salicampi]MCP8617928.1 hypothetical protein [Salirhabdus salicampi]
MKKNHAMAYTTIAMKQLGYSKREIEQITNEMLSQFEKYGEEEVEDRADEILYDEE